MKTVQNLLKAERNTKLGNHRVDFSTNSLGHDVKAFYYYATIICLVNDTKETFTIDDSYGTMSTKRACNSYRNELLNKGYREIKL